MRFRDRARVRMCLWVFKKNCMWVFLCGIFFGGCGGGRISLGLLFIACLSVFSKDHVCVSIYFVQLHGMNLVNHYIQRRLLVATCAAKTGDEGSPRPELPLCYPPSRPPGVCTQPAAETVASPETPRKQSSFPRQRPYFETWSLASTASVSMSCIVLSSALVLKGE